MSQPQVTAEPRAADRPAETVAPDLGRFSRMHPIRWVPPDAAELLDVGCNVGALLQHVGEVYPNIRRAGVEIHRECLGSPDAPCPTPICTSPARSGSPFDDGRFDCVTCIEVIEHVPEADRAGASPRCAGCSAPGAG
ncbi:MAG: methyltransferase domain-containing protein [Isosphaeraceae bacterium]